MPRKAKRTITNKPAQAVSPVPGQMYGAGVEQMQMQRSMPAPNLRSASSPGSSAGPAVSPAARMPGEPPQPVMQAAQPSEADRYQQALDAAQGMREQVGLLTRPSARPYEPVTAGLSTGPGVGPEILGAQRRNPTAETFQRLAELTGDTYLADLARRAGF